MPWVWDVCAESWCEQITGRMNKDAELKLRQPTRSPAPDNLVAPVDTCAGQGWGADGLMGRRLPGERSPIENEQLSTWV